MINPPLFTVKTSSNTTRSHHASAESLAQSSTADRFTRMKVLDETNVVGNEKTINPDLQLPEKLSLVVGFAVVDVWGQINNKNEFGLFSSTRTSNQVFERILRDSACILELA